MAAASTTPTALPPSPRPRWLYGPFWDLMIGCGGAYLVLFLFLLASGPTVLRVASQGLIPMALLFTAVPHYGATLLRVYEHRNDRRTYAIFSVWATLLVWAAFVVGVYHVAFGSLLVTLFLTWSPWHYSGQNYGVGLMLIGRGGVRVSPRAKRFLWVSFFSSWLLVVFATHGEIPGGTYAPTATSLSDSVYAFIPVGIPIAVLGPLLLVTSLVYFGSVIACFALLRREASWRQLSPLLGVVALQGVWFSIPVMTRATAFLQDTVAFGVQHQSYVLLWMALGHSLQYLWVTTYFATTAKTDSRLGRYWVKAFFAGGALFAVPVFLFSPDAFGVYAFESGFGLLIAAAVNLQHFVLDGAIWKLRDGRIARILLRRSEDPVSTDAFGGPTPSRPWGRRTAWSLIGVAGLAYAVFYGVGIFELEYGFRRALDPLDPERMRVAARRLASVGHDHPGLRLNLGVIALREGDTETARREALRSIELGPSVEAWMLLGQIHQGTEDWERARADYEAALELAPTHVPALGQLGLVSMKLGDYERAEEALARAVELAPGRKVLAQRLEEVRRLARGAPHARPSEPQTEASAELLDAPRPVIY